MLDRRWQSRGRDRAAARPIGCSIRPGLERCTRCARRCDQPDCHRPRAHPRDRARGLTQAQGNLQSACRSVQWSGVSPWPDGPGLVAISDPDVHAHRCGGGRNAPACSRSASQGHRAVRCGARCSRCRASARARQRSRRNRRRLPHPELLRDVHQLWRNAWVPTSTTPATCRKSLGPDEPIESTRGAGQHRLRRRRLAS